MNTDDSTSSTKRILYACLAGALIIALVLVVGFGIHHHHDDLQTQMSKQTWQIQMLYHDKNIYSKNVTFYTDDGESAKIHVPHVSKPLSVPIHFYNSSKRLKIGNSSQGEILQSTSNTQTNHYFIIHKVYKNGLPLHKHVKLMRRDFAFNFIRKN